uniref:Endonuclease/exonuclease/phosphatase family domain-containing protein 1 n=1 Tax=Eptatretus burgeri TaxID=7764 RepID=A0A8C4WXG1_EPTBU
MGGSLTCHSRKSSGVNGTSTSRCSGRCKTNSNGAVVGRTRHKRKVSAVCNFRDISGHPAVGEETGSAEDSLTALPLAERLNVNLATEEQLMTLPGVSRAMAQAMVRHRRIIGGFRRVEDVALVPGVGAANLELIRSEIWTGRLISPTRLAGAAPPTRGTCAECLSHPRININTASQTELLGMDGIDERVSTNIVRHRVRCGGFKSVDDLGCVCGMSAALLERIRPQVFAGLMRPASFCGARGCGVGLFHHATSSPTSRSLQCVGQATVAVTRACSSIPRLQAKEDGSVGSNSTSEVFPYTRIHEPDCGLVTWQCHTHTTRSVSSSGTRPAFPVPEKLLSWSSPAVNWANASQPSLAMMARPGGLFSVRPVTRPFNGFYNGRTVVRVASWNVQRCSQSKVSNPGVREILCMSILENGISFVALQDLMDMEALEMLCAELNRPALTAVASWPEGRGEWCCLVSSESQTPWGTERLGFLWNTHAGIQLVPGEAQELPTKGSTNGKAQLQAALINHFQVGSLELIAVNLHWQCSSLQGTHENFLDGGSAQPSFEHDHNNGNKGSKPMIIIMASFVGQVGKVSPLCSTSFLSALPHDASTAARPPASENTCSLSGVWFSQASTQAFTGRSAVVREGLCSTWIPDGWMWGGLASDHCPVWAEFYTDCQLLG